MRRAQEWTKAEIQAARRLVDAMVAEKDAAGLKHQSSHYYYSAAKRTDAAIERVRRILDSRYGAGAGKGART